jgi:hypothetical protein
VADSDGSDKPAKPRTGRVRHDAGGRAIWEWAIDSGKYALDSTSRLLKKLELTGITLMSDDARPWADPSRPADDAPARREERGRVRSQDTPPAVRHTPLVGDPDPREAGFNPYDTRTPVGRGAVPQKKPAPPKPRITQPPARKRGFFARLFGRR